MNILLTGASGFAGAHMLQYLIENTNSRIYCPVTYTHGGHKERIPALVEKTDLERVIIFEHDLAAHPIENTGYFEGIDLIINFASEPGNVKNLIQTSPYYIICNKAFYR